MSRSKTETVGSHWLSRMKWCELVRVDSAVMLVNSRRHACHYVTVDGAPLAAGYYLALWPAGACLSFYGQEVLYLGPFATKDAVLLLHASALWLGLTDTGFSSHQLSSHPASPAQHWQPPHPESGLTPAAAAESPASPGG